MTDPVTPPATAPATAPGTPSLRTRRLRLDPYVPKGEGEFVALFQDPSVAV